MAMNWKKAAIATGFAISLLGAVAYAQPYLRPVHGPGMMGGYGNAYGMMDDDHMRPGFTQGYGMGPGMMGGYGGYGYGMGPGMMGGLGLGAIHRLSLTDTQRDQVRSIENDLRKKNWDLMGQMQQEMSTVYDRGSASSKPDRAALLAANKRMFELRQKMLENQLDAQDKAEALLTPQQKEQYKNLAGSYCNDLR
jgi:Spy/CpxP family protein refolding chaperone